MKLRSFLIPTTLPLLGLLCIHYGKKLDGTINTDEHYRQKTEAMVTKKLHGEENGLTKKYEEIGWFLPDFNFKEKLVEHIEGITPGIVSAAEEKIADKKKRNSIIFQLSGLLTALAVSMGGYIAVDSIADKRRKKRLVKYHGHESMLDWQLSGENLWEGATNSLINQ